jgi:hypothetical protein
MVLAMYNIVFLKKKKNQASSALLDTGELHNPMSTSGNVFQATANDKVNMCNEQGKFLA